VEIPKVRPSIVAAMRVVPNFDRTSSGQADHFLRACDFAVRIVDPEKIDSTRINSKVTRESVAVDKV